jgi:HSP20 family protein
MEQFFSPSERRELQPVAWTPSVDVYEHNGDVVIEAELPGVKREDVDVSLQDSTLTIRGEMKREEERKEEGYLRRERHYGRFVRSVPLPTLVKADQAKAKFQEGVLRVTLPKAEEEAKGQKIKVE